jgi:hypothetical protein
MCNIDTVQNISVTSQHTAHSQYPRTFRPQTAAPAAPKCLCTADNTLLLSPTRVSVLQTLVCSD